MHLGRLERREPTGRFEQASVVDIMALSVSASRGLGGHGASNRAMTVLLQAQAGGVLGSEGGQVWATIKGRVSLLCQGQAGVRLHL